MTLLSGKKIPPNPICNTGSMIELQYLLQDETNRGDSGRKGRVREQL